MVLPALCFAGRGGAVCGEKQTCDFTSCVLLGSFVDGLTDCSLSLSTQTLDRSSWPTPLDMPDAKYLVPWTRLL